MADDGAVLAFLMGDGGAVLPLSARPRVVSKASNETDLFILVSSLSISKRSRSAFFESNDAFRRWNDAVRRRSASSAPSADIDLLRLGPPATGLAFRRVGRPSPSDVLLLLQGSELLLFLE